MASQDDKDTERPVHLRLFDFSEEEIKAINYYQILGLEEPVRATPYTIKQAYRKASIRYHPDKTGRDESDYVFIAVKNAWDTLSDVAKRQAYDSTEMPFDDSIPPDPNAASFHDELDGDDGDDDDTNNNNNNSAANFYDTFGPVFERNLRFDTRLQQQTSSKQAKDQEIPSLGDPDTPIEKVQAFYDYWTRFDSWRDFSQKAQEELFENNNPLEDAESRYEKRFYQKEIDKRAKVLKRQEINRIQTLVQRAMASDPRLQAHYKQQKLAKELAANERQLKIAQEKAKREREELDRQTQEAERQERERIQRAQDKAHREKEKKQLRKAKQQLRKVTVAAFQHQPNNEQHHHHHHQHNHNHQHNHQHQNDSHQHNHQQQHHHPVVFKTLEEMSDEVEFLCGELNLHQIHDLTHAFTKSKDFTLVQQCANETRKIKEQEQLAEAQEIAERRQKEEEEERRKAQAIAESKAWSQLELSALAKAVKKFPGGGANRWEQIASYINTMCRPEEPRTREECIEKYNQIAKGGGGGPGPTTTAPVPATAPAPVPATTTTTTASATATATTTPSGKAAGTGPTSTIPVVNGLSKKNSRGATAAATVAVTTSTTTATATENRAPPTTNGTTANRHATPADNNNNSNPKATDVSTAPASATTTTTNTTLEATTGAAGGGAAAAAADVWSDEQDKQLQEGLAKFPATMDKNERWTSIAKMVNGKSKKQCVQRFKAIRDAIKSKK